MAETIEETVEAMEESAQHTSGNTQNSRLLITKIVMENFKSYGGVREIGPFHKCFSSIVGPNGSGKSNVIDAMLFVFGKKAKKLRLNKVSELIHRSEQYPNLESTRVSVHFVDILDDPLSEDAYTEIAGTELVVTRSAYKNNTSKYQVDGKTATFTEVGALLRRRGIDLDNNRFLILQGEVEQIAMMKPKAETEHDEGLLEYLEDIIGSNRHVEATEIAAKEVGELNDQRAEKLNRVKAAEKDKEGLEGAKVEAEAFLGKERDIRCQRNILYQKNILETAAYAQDVEEKTVELKAKQAKDREKLVETEAVLKDIEAKYDHMTGAYNAIMTELARTKEEFAEYERKDIKYQEDIKFLKAQAKKLEAQAKKDAKSIADFQLKADAHSDALPKLEKAAALALEKRSAAELALDVVNEEQKGETAELRSQLEALQEEVAPAAEVHANLKRKQDTAECEIALVEEETGAAKKQLAATEAALAKLLKDTKACEESLREGEKESENLQARASNIAMELKECGKHEVTALASMAESIARAEEAKAAFESVGGATAAVRALLEASRPGGPLANAGILGRLGSLGAIDQRYDIAVSTACPHLDHIVVETATGGAACVEYLRAHSIGRASFVILEQLGHLEGAMNAQFAAPIGTQRLFDLVRISDQRCKPAFYLGLRDTLVAPDLDAATAAAYHGGRCVARVVTEAGQLIDRSGAMTGGGGTPRRGGMGPVATGGASGINAQDVARLDAAAKASQEAVQAIRAQQRKLNEELASGAKRLRALTVAVPKLEQQIAAADASAAQYRSEAERARADCEPTPEAIERVAQLKASVKAGSGEIAKAAKALAKLQSAVSDLQKRILEAGGVKLAKATKVATAAAEEAESAAGAVSAAKVGIAAEMKKKTRAIADAARHAKELEEGQAALVVAQAEFKALEDAAFVVMTAFENTQKAADERRKELETATAEYDEKRAIVTKVRNADVDIVHQLDEYSALLDECKAKAKHWKAELEKVRAAHQRDLDDWGDFGQEEETENVSEGAGQAGVSSNDMQVGAEEEDGAGEYKDNMDVVQENITESGEKVCENAKKSKRMLADLSAEELERHDRDEIKHTIAGLEKERDALKASVNMTALLEYRRKEGEYLGRVRELDEITELRNASRRRHEDLRRQRLEEFMAGFGIITLKLKEMYQMITLGGDAELELVDSLDPFSEGIVFSVRPPKKSWKHIANLSGGEKTLSSLALVFALHHFKPTPLYVMDEIDAALDYKNVSIVANYIKERTKDAQFIIISLRNNMFELADRLVGIYKTHDVTKSVTINPKQFSMQAAPVADVQNSAEGGLALGNRTNTA